jgi:hypothetical protein
MSNLQNDTQPATSYGKKAMICAILAAIAFIISAVLTAYGIVCPTSDGVCLPRTINSVLSGTSVFLLTAGTLLTVLGILAAVESIAVMEKTRKPYVALSLLLFSVLGITGTVYQFFILKIVGIVFPGSY